MQRLPCGFAAVLSILSLITSPACGDKQGDAKAEAGEPAAAGDAGAVDAKADAGDAKAEGGDAKAEGGDAKAEGDDASAQGEGAGAQGDGAAEGAGETGAAVAAETGEEDPVPALYEQAKSLDTDDEAATKALEDAIAAGAAKLDAAKVANERGEALMIKGESERAEAFFVWARDKHKLFAEPVYNLAKIAAYAGDLELAKEHLTELQTRGNKKLMKKVGVEPAFAPLHDDPDVRKIYEQ